MKPCHESDRRETDVDPSVIDITDAEAPLKGFVCPKCECQDMRVGCTRSHDGGVRRYRYCRNCGRGLPTEEVPASLLADMRRRLDLAAGLFQS